MTGPPSPPDAAPRRPLAGRASVLLVLDVGREIHLARAEARLAEQPLQRAYRRKRRVRTGSGEMPVPLRVELRNEAAAARLGRPDVSLEAALYEIGAVCLTWSWPVVAPVEEWIALSAELYEREDLAEASRDLARELRDALGDAVERPGMSDEYEDYVVFELEEVEGVSEHDLARLLRAEPERLSPQEVEDALHAPLSYAPGEVCHVDWGAALLVGADMLDERMVLELANVELLEQRFLEALLSLEVEEAYSSLRTARRGLASLAPRSAELERLAALQADDVLLHLGIRNAVKVLGDDYLARLHRRAADRFHLDDWDASIRHELEVLEGIHDKLAAAAGRRRAELLEWIIILLIAVDIVIVLA